MEDTNQAPHASTDPSSSSSSLERRPSGDEDSAAMTIEFLRARLLSERSVSKAARQRAQQLSKKISELEERLEAEIRLRRKLEADRLEILSKYRAELSEEYGEFFASSFGEGVSRNESHMPNEEEEGLSSSRAEHLDRSDSSQRLNHEEANDEDEETDQSGREKGVLSWGRPKGSRREFGHGTDWLGRSLSQRSLASTDGESPQKKWAGKSVRQIRKRESRPFGSNLEGEAGQSQVSEDFDGKSGQPDDVKERLQCEDERDTEVERVLERQAELIGKFEAEENAQRAWEEAKFKEEKALAGHGTGITQSLAKDGAIEAESDGATRDSRKVHPESSSEEIQVQSKIFQREASEYTSGIESEKNKSALTAAVEKEGMLGVVESTKEVRSPNERFTEIDPPDEDGRLYAGSSSSVLKDSLSQDQVLSNTDTEERVEHSKAPGKASKYKKHLSSSFRFTVFADAEPVTSSSPDMPGFAAYKQEMDKVETDKVEEGEVGKEEVLLNGSTAGSEQMSGFGLSEPHHDEPHYHIAVTASLDHHVDRPLVSEDRTFATKDTESQEKSKGILQEATHEQETLAAENGVRNHSSNDEVGNDVISDSNREEILKRTLGVGGSQDVGRYYSDFPSYPEFRGPGAGLQPGLGRPYSDFPHPSVQRLQVASMDSDGANFDNLASLPNYRSGVPGPVLNANAYDDTAFGSQQHRSVDSGFDRVADVLRALQIAKYQIESSSEQATPLAIDTPYRNGYDGRDAYYAVPPRLPSVYAAPPQYTSPVPYTSRGVPPFSQNMQGWSYGASSSRQLANAPYMHYASWVPEPQRLWPPPPSQGGHHSNLYQYDTRQHR